MLNETKTSAVLRLLAQRIEEGNSPDFFFCMINDDGTFSNVFVSEKDPFALIGIVDVVKRRIPIE